MPLKLDLKNEKVFLVVAGVVLVIFSVLLFIVLMPKKKGDDGKYLIDTPYSFSTTMNVTISDEVKKELEVPKNINVYGLTKVDLNLDIDKFLSALGKSYLKKKAYTETLYIWSKGDEYVEYVPNLQSLYFKFTTPASTQMVSSNGVDGAGYLDSLAQNYLGKSYKYINENIVKQGYQVRIEANRSIDNYPLYLPTDAKYSDYVVVDSSGKLYEGKLNLMVIDTGSSEKVKTVSLDYLSNVISGDMYPKLVYQGFYSGSVTKQSTAPANSDQLDVINKTQLAKLSKAKSIALGYLFKDSTYTQLVPTYRIVAEGETVYDGKNILVPIVVLTNAVDPSKIYLPTSNE